MLGIIILLRLLLNIITELKLERLEETVGWKLAVDKFSVGDVLLTLLP